MDAAIPLAIIPFFWIILSWFMHKRGSESAMIFLFINMAFLSMLILSSFLVIDFATSTSTYAGNVTYNWNQSNFGTITTGATSAAYVIFIMISIALWGIQWYTQNKKII